jgi:hypothetical protein
VLIYRFLERRSNKYSSCQQFQLSNQPNLRCLPKVLVVLQTLEHTGTLDERQEREKKTIAEVLLLCGIADSGTQTGTLDERQKKGDENDRRSATPAELVGQVAVCWSRSPSVSRGRRLLVTVAPSHVTVTSVTKTSRLQSHITLSVSIVLLLILVRFLFASFTRSRRHLSLCKCQ